MSIAKKQKWLVIGLTLLIIIAALGVFLIARTDTEEPAAVAYPEFILKNSNSLGWWSPGNFPPQMEEPNYPRDLWASISAHDSKEIGRDSDCHVSFFYFSSTKNVHTAIQERKSEMANTGDMTREQMAIKPMTLNTPEGVKSYDLYQYNLVGRSSEALKRGIETGYITLSNGYVEVQGHCSTYEKLSTTLSVLSAVELRSQDQVPGDICHSEDWQEDNCVPAGQCTPNGERDHVVDCFDLVTDYDRKFNTEL